MTWTRALVLASALLASTFGFAQDEDFSIVVLPDTQNYSAKNPAIFNAQTQWIADHAAALNIKMVLHEGDIVDGGGDLAQWANADAAMKKIDGVAPYIAVIGNHDYDYADPKGRTASTVNFNQYFGPSRYSGKSWYQGSYQPGSNENFYSFVTVGARTFLVLALEVYPRDAVLDWANAVIDANPDKEVIVLTHSYMFGDDTRVGRCDQGGKVDLQVKNDNDGDGMWDKLVRKHANISLVLSGHIVWNGGIGRRADLGDNGNLVNQMLADFQNYANGGNGYLRILTFHSASNAIDVQTFSPWLDQWLTDARNQFTVKWHADGSMAGQPSLVQGRVRSDLDCKVIAGATINADDATATADANAAFSMTTMASAPTITASAAGWLAKTLQVPAPAGAGAQAEFFLTPAGRLSGTVTDTSGLPIANAAVDVSGGYQPASLSFTTDSNGSFTSDWISAGNYTMTATLKGKSATQAVTIVGGQTATPTIVLDTKPQQGTYLSGTVTSAIDGHALSGATVTAGGQSAVSDTAGKFAFTGLAAGTYTVTAAKSGWGSQSVSATLVDGSATTANIKLSTSGKIAGTVTRADGSPASGMQVTISGGVIATTITLTTNASGAFASTWIPVGNYSVSVATSSGTSVSVSTQVTSGQTSTVAIQTDEAPSSGSTSPQLVGRVLSAIDGTPIAGATVTAGAETTTTTTTGSYIFENPTAGTYTITAAKSGWGKQSTTVTVGSGTTTAPDIKLATSGRISGTVKTSSGTAISGAAVTFSGGVIANSTSVKTGSTGSYVSGWIPVGDYSVSVATSAGTKTGTAKVIAGGNTVLNFTM